MKEQVSLISVVVLTYNSSLFIRETLNSIIQQDYENFEIIVADDGSEDSTPLILKEYSQSFSNIKLILNKSNRGITKNCNSAFFECRGDYIVFIGGDDLMLPEKLSIQASVLSEDPDLLFCYHNVEAFDNITLNALWHRRDKYLCEGLTLKKMIKYGNQLISCEIMFRRCFVPQNGFNEMFIMMSDYVFNLEVFLNNPNGRIKYINKVLARYRIHPRSVTKDLNPKMKKIMELDRMNVFNWLVVNCPDYLNEARCYYSLVLRGMRKSNNRTYSDFLWLSIRLKFNFKSVFGLLLFYLSFRSIKC